MLEQTSFNAFRLRQAAVDLSKRVGSTRTRRRIKFGVVGLRSQILVSKRPLPAFLVIGTMRGGTSSLFKYLASHPDTAASLRKEVAFFTRYWVRGNDWYRGHFPMTRTRLAYEATPDYLFHPLAAGRAAQTVPDSRLIVLLREPLARACSDHLHMTRLGFEKRSFLQAIEEEDEAVSHPHLDLQKPESETHKWFLRYAYMSRGRYVEQLNRWLDYFPPERFLILFSEDLYARTAERLARVAEFLALDPAGFVGLSRNYSRSAKRSVSRPGTLLPDWQSARLERDNTALLALLRRRFPAIELPTWLR